MSSRLPGKHIPAWRRGNVPTDPATSWQDVSESRDPRPGGAAFGLRCSGVEALSTEGLAGTKRLEFWNEVVCNTFTSLTVDVPHHAIDAKMRRQSLGDVRIAIADSTSATVMHTREHLSMCSDPFFLLHVQLAGNSVNQQSGREVCLSPGDLTLFDSTRPYRVAFDCWTSIMVIRIPRGSLRKYVACPENLTMLPMRRSSAANGLTTRFIRDLWQRLPQVTAQASRRHLADAMMNLIAAACATLPRAAVESSTRAAALRIRLTELIEANLWDPDLDPQAIAQKGRISLRYLHLLFRQQGESVSRYVQRRRLEECARLLGDPLRAGSSVTQIACEHGFKSSAQFCRAFRAHYSMTPSDYRASQCTVRQR
jgi:AraC-like DNA-binding protein